MRLMSKNPLVTLYGPNYIHNEWTLSCMKSWDNILNVSSDEFYVLPDQKLSYEEESVFEDMAFKVVKMEKEIESFLSGYPGLKYMREKDPTWRKILDIAIAFPAAEKIIIIDTDVLINDKVLLPLENFDIAYMREDIPAYRGSWDMVWKEKMVPALNAGIIIVDPKIIDFDYLETIALKYLKGCKDYWWSEQSAWACLAGRSERRRMFSGKQVRVTSGMRQRSAEEISNNSYNYFGKKEMIKEYEEFEDLLQEGSIFHFAGPGKYMFKRSQDYLKTISKEHTVEIDVQSENTLTLKDKCLISLRLFLKERF